MKTPVVIFPTESVLIDDDTLYARLFAKNMLRNEGVSLKPLASLSDILEQKDNDFIFSTYAKAGRIKHRNELAKSPAQTQKQLEGAVSVIVADFHMPGMNGIEFFKEIKSPFVHKILISNFIDSKYSDYINKAINNNTINAVLDKKRKLEQSLKQCITTGHNRFFSLLSSELIPAKNNKISDPEFAQFIWGMIDDIKPEGVHANEQLSCFYFRHKNKQRKLYITSPDEITLLLESYQAETVANTILEKLASHKYMLSAPDPFSIEANTWADFLRPAQKLKGRFNDYLFTTVEEEMHE